MTLDQMVLFATSAVRDEHQSLVKVAYALRAAYHADGDDFKQFVGSLEVKDPAEELSHEQSAAELWKDFTSGDFLAPKGSGKTGRKKGLVPQK